MLIVCSIRRSKGTHPKMPDDGTVYSFLPNAKGDHVCEVANLAHAERLLAIPSFSLYAEGDLELEAAIDAGDLEQTATVADLNSMTLEELQEEYHYRFGKAAHPQSKHSTLVKKLTEARLAPDDTE